MRVLDELEREIARVASEAGDVRRRRRWWRPGMLVVVLPLGLAAAAVAATSAILVGDPVKNPPGARLNLNPKAGLGVLVGSGKLLGVRAADPQGGPEWGLRMIRTSRAFGCVQLGRVVDGRLGVIGRDGTFGDDGKFHERGVEVLQQTDCQLADGAGNHFIAMTYLGLPASADPAGCVARTNSPGGRPVCPTGSLRTVFYGLLGPEAKAITYVDAAGAVVRQPVRGPNGAYLVVRPIDPERRNFYYSPGVTPGSGLRTVEYRDGSVCRIVSPRRRGGARRCPLKGFVAPKLPRISAADLATPVHVEVGTRPEHPWPNVKLLKGTRPIPAQRRVTITFRARLAADTRSFYTINSLMKAGPRCSYGTFGPITRDVKAGSVISEKLYVAYRCRGTMTIEVGYAQQRRPGPMPFDFGGRGNAKVGRVTVELR